jgi:hypothetical protein
MKKGRQGPLVFHEHLLAWASCAHLSIASELAGDADAGDLGPALTAETPLCRHVPVAARRTAGSIGRGLDERPAHAFGVILGGRPRSSRRADWRRIGHSPVYDDRVDPQRQSWGSPNAHATSW